MASRTLIVNFVGDSTQLDATVKKSSSSLDKFAKSAIALGGSYLGLGAAKTAIDNTEALGESVLKLHSAFGLSMKDATAWGAQVQARGGDASQLMMSFKTLSTQVLAGAAGSKTAVRAFADLGISQQDLQKHGNDLEWVLGKVSDGLSRLPAGTERGADAGKLLGRSYQSLIPLLAGGSAEMNKQLGLVSQFGVSFSGGAKGLEAMRQKQIELKLASMGLQAQFTEQVAPTLLALGTDIVKVINALKPFKTEVELLGGTIAAALAYKRIKGGVVELGGDMMKLAAKMGLYSTATVEANAKAAASFEATAGAATAGAAKVETTVAAEAVVVEASDAKIAAANATSGGSFAAGSFAGAASRFALPAVAAFTAIPVIGHYLAPQLEKMFGGGLKGLGASVPGFTQAQFELPGGAGSVNRIKTLQDQLNGVKGPAQRSLAQWKSYAAEVTKIQRTLPDMTGSQRQGFTALQSAINGSITALHKYDTAKKQVHATSAAATGSAVPSVSKQVMQVASLTLQGTRITDQTKLATDTAAAQTTIVNERQLLASQGLQAAAKNLSDSAAVVQADFAAAAQKIDAASTLAHDRASATVQGMQDATQVQTDILAERNLYGAQLIAQRLQVQLDVMKAGFNRQEAILQQNADVTKAHWDGKIAADQIRVATVTQHQDQLVAIAQQKATQVQLHADMLLGNATRHADLVALGTGMKVALAQQAVTLSAAAPRAQQLAAQQALSLAQARGGKANAVASRNLGNVTASTNAAVALSSGSYQRAQDIAALAVGRAQSGLSHDQGAAQLAESIANALLGRLTDKASILEQRLQDRVTLTQAGAIQRTNSDSQKLTHKGGTHHATTIHVHVNGNTHVTEAEKLANQIRLALRTLPVGVGT